MTHGVGQNRTEPDISGQPDIVGQKRVVACGRVWCRITCHKVGRVRKEPVPDRVPEGRSRAHGAGAEHGVGDGRRVRYHPSPDRVRYLPSPDHVSSYPGPCRRPHVSAVVTDGRTARPSFAMPRPNSACNRRRHRRFTNVYSCVMPWRFMMARSAARLRRGVGRHLNPKGPCRTAQAAIKRVPVIHSSK